MKTNRLLIKVALSSVIAASAFILTPSVVLAQVKIGSNPATIGTTSNLEVESSNGTKVIVDKATGQLGAGVTDPTQSIDASGTARLRNIPVNVTNSQILTVDANGVVAKQNAQASQLPVVTGILGAGVSAPLTTTGYVDTGTRITIPANSKYAVNITMLLNVTGVLIDDANAWIRSSLFNSVTETVPSTDIVSGSNLISGLLTTNTFFGIANGSIIVQNSTNSPKTYYYKVGRIEVNPASAASYYSLNRFGGTYWGENQIYGIPIN